MMTASGSNASAIPGGCDENKRLSEDEGVIFSWLLWTLARDVVTCFKIGPAEKRRALSQRAFGKCRSGKEFCETLHPTCVFMCVTLALTSGLTPLFLFQNHETALASLLVLSCNGFPVASNGVGYLWRWVRGRHGRNGPGRPRRGAAAAGVQRATAEA